MASRRSSRAGSTTCYHAHMNADLSTSVAALFIHGERGTRRGDATPTPMLAVHEVEAVTGWGIRQDARFFRPPDPGRPRVRQVSLIDEGTIGRHEQRFGPIPWRLVKSQMVLKGDIHLPDMIGAVLEFEDGPALTVAIARDPCFAMDLIAPGMKDAMEDGEQGALAQVTRDGLIRVGQSVIVRRPVTVI